jgi:hypothetical protein
MSNTNKTLILALLAAITVGCGYSKPAPPSTPAIQQLNPASATAGGAQFQLEVDGTNFSGSAYVNFNGVRESTTVVNSGKLNAMIPASAIVNAGTVPVTVTNPGSSGGGGIYGGGMGSSVTSAPVNFTIN